MAQTPNQNPVLLAVVSGAALVVVLVLIFFLAHPSNTPQPTATPTVATRITPAPTPTPTTEVTGIATPTASPTAGVIPTAIPTEGVISLPTTVKTFLANFYTSYKAQDRERLATLFTPDTTSENASLHATLFTGKDTQGNPGGPTLFSTNSAAEWVTDYTLLGSAPQGVNWVVTSRENRASANSNDTGTQTTLITLVPAPSGQGTWLIDGYTHAGSSSKYNGFLTQ